MLKKPHPSPKEIMFSPQTIINHAKEPSLRSDPSEANTARGPGWSMYYVVCSVYYSRPCPNASYFGRCQPQPLLADRGSRDIENIITTLAFFSS